MKRIITGIVIVIALVIIGIIVFILVHKGQDILSAANEQDLNTELLQVQTKVKKIELDSEMKNDTNQLKGQKFSDCTEEYAQKLKDEGTISEKDTNYKYYYIWDQSVLDELSLNIKLKDGEVYIVNYITSEVIQATTSDTDMNVHSTNDIQL